MVLCAYVRVHMCVLVCVLVFLPANRMEELEFQAKLQMLVGRCKGLPKDEVERLSKM